MWHAFLTELVPTFIDDFTALSPKFEFLFLFRAFAFAHVKAVQWYFRETYMGMTGCAFDGPSITVFLAVILVLVLITVVVLSSDSRGFWCFIAVNWHGWSSDVSWPPLSFVVMYSAFIPQIISTLLWPIPKQSDHSFCFLIALSRLLPLWFFCRNPSKPWALGSPIFVIAISMYVCAQLAMIFLLDHFLVSLERLFPDAPGNYTHSDNSEPDGVCPICHEGFDNGETIMTALCSHISQQMSPEKDRKPSVLFRLSLLSSGPALIVARKVVHKLYISLIIRKSFQDEMRSLLRRPMSFQARHSKACHPFLQCPVAPLGRW
jgi:hypothetical protein